jgi:hypothetical protein
MRGAPSHLPTSPPAQPGCNGSTCRHCPASFWNCPGGGWRPPGRRRAGARHLVRSAVTRGSAIRRPAASAAGCKGSPVRPCHFWLGWLSGGRGRTSV